MDALQAFLTANLEIEKDVSIKRLSTVLRIKALGTADIENASQRCTYPVGKGNKRENKLDQTKLNAVLIQKSCINIDFSNKDLLEKYKASDAIDCILKALLPGEITMIVDAILELSGYGDTEEAVEEAKN